MHGSTLRLAVIVARDQHGRLTAKPTSNSGLWCVRANNIASRQAQADSFIGKLSGGGQSVAGGGRNDAVGVLCDTQIESQIRIEPFEPARKRPGTISFGVSSYGYDIRVGSRFKVFSATPPHGDLACVDPKAFSDDMMVEIDAGPAGAGGNGKGFVIIPPNSFALCETVELVEIPRDVLAICVGKSTYARCGIIVNVTPIEPEWRGRITLEISNTTPLPAKIYAGEGIAQLIFLRADEVCATSYADKAGKYQDQEGLTLPKVD